MNRPSTSQDIAPDVNIRLLNIGHKKTAEAVLGKLIWEWKQNYDR
jgi:hypothetical protein